MRCWESLGPICFKSLILQVWSLGTWHETGNQMLMFFYLFKVRRWSRPCPKWQKVSSKFHCRSGFWEIYIYVLCYHQCKLNSVWPWTPLFPHCAWHLKDGVKRRFTVIRGVWMIWESADICKVETIHTVDYAWINIRQNQNRSGQQAEACQTC